MRVRIEKLPVSVVNPNDTIFNLGKWKFPHDRIWQSQGQIYSDEVIRDFKYPFTSYNYQVHIDEAVDDLYEIEWLVNGVPLKFSEETSSFYNKGRWMTIITKKYSAKNIDVHPVKRYANDDDDHQATKPISRENEIIRAQKTGSYELGFSDPLTKLDTRDPLRYNNTTPEHRANEVQQSYLERIKIRNEFKTTINIAIDLANMDNDGSVDWRNISILCNYVVRRIEVKIYKLKYEERRLGRNISCSLKRDKDSNGQDIILATHTLRDQYHNTVTHRENWKFNWARLEDWNWLKEWMHKNRKFPPVPIKLPDLWHDPRVRYLFENKIALQKAYISLSEDKKSELKPNDFLTGISLVTGVPEEFIKTLVIPEYEFDAKRIENNEIPQKFFESKPPNEINEA